MATSDESGRQAAPPRDDVIRRVRDLIRIEMTDGIARGGTGAIATESDLMTRYRLPREIVREALHLLAEEGVIERRRGLGTRSAGDHPTMSAFLPPLTLTLESHLRSGKVTPRVLHWAWVSAPRPVAERLEGVEAGDRCLCVDYVMLAEGRPLAVITNYLRASEAVSVRREQFRTDFYALLADAGISVASHDVTVQATIADASRATLLGVETGDPILLFEQVIRDDAGEAIDFAVCHLRREVRPHFAFIPRADAAGFGGRGAAPGEG